jgi:TAG lipase/steryl ester hydrolase/phospholipase A2/LPA acyltransferase
MDRLYHFQTPLGLDLLGHGQASWDDDGRPVKKRRTVVGGYASLVQPLTQLVQDSVDSVQNSVDTAKDLTSALFSLELSDLRAFAAGFSDDQLRLLTVEDEDRWRQTTRLQGAKAHGAWLQAAKELDKLDGCDEWKAQDEDEHYDHEDLKRKLQNLESARDNEDLVRMLRVIRTELGRDVAGIGNPKLYEQSRVGTKDLIERYVTTAVDTIECALRLAARSKDGRTAGKVREAVVETRQSYGRTALLLSGGGTMGMMHIGVIKAMFEAGVLPRVISGASAGSIVAAVVCTKTDDEIPGLLGEFCNDLDVFTKGEDQARWSSMMYRLFTKGSLYDIKNLENVMQGHVKDMTFQEAYYRTQRILSIAVSHESSEDEPLLLNYATAPNVLIRSAVAASCSVPFIYRPAPLYEKNPLTNEIQRYGGEDQYYIDGSVSHDIPLGRLRAMFDVNHFIVSQVNPHIAPFIRKGQTSTEVHPSQRSWTDTLTEMARTEVVYRLRQLSDIPFPVIKKLTHIGSSILEQTYTGDITILPETSFGYAVLSNPTPQFMVDAMEKGEKATWPELDRIQQRTAVERAIDKSVGEATSRVHFSESQVNLRLEAMREKSTAEAIRDRGRGRRASAGMDHRNTESMVITGSKQLGTDSPMEDPLTRERSPRSSSEDGTRTSRSPSLIPDFTSSSPQLTDTDESETDSLHQHKFPNPSKSNTWAARPGDGIFNFPMGSYSQPTTPSVVSKAFDFSPSPRPSSPILTHAATFAMTPASPAPSATSSKQAAQPALPPRPPSSPERQYKKLFHGVKGLKMRSPGSKSPSSQTMSAPENADGSNSGDGRPSRSFPASLLARGGKRSISTGMKGLKPPGRQ